MINKICKGITQPQKIPPYVSQRSKIIRFKINKKFRGNKSQLSIEGHTSQFVTYNYPDLKYLDEFSEQRIVSDCLDRISPNDVFWDVGANIGIYSCFVGNTGADVVSFEPDDPTRTVLEKNAKANDIDATILSLGLSDGNKTLNRELNMQRENELTTFDSLPGDKIIDKGLAPAPTVIKIDIEGMEYSALRGLSESINNVRLLYVELHPEYLSERGESESVVKEWLKDKGFNLSTIPYSNGNPIIRAKKEN